MLSSTKDKKKKQDDVSAALRRYYEARPKEPRKPIDTTLIPIDTLGGGRLRPEPAHTTATQAQVRPVPKSTEGTSRQITAESLIQNKLNELGVQAPSPATTEELTSALQQNEVARVKPARLQSGGETPIQSLTDRNLLEQVGAPTPTNPVGNVQEAKSWARQGIDAVGAFLGSDKGQEFFGNIAVLLGEQGSGSAVLGQQIADAARERMEGGTTAEIFSRLLAGEDPELIDMSGISLDAQKDALGLYTTLQDLEIRREALQNESDKLAIEADKVANDANKPIDATMRNAIENDTAAVFFREARNQLPAGMQQLEAFMLAMSGTEGNVSPAKIRLLLSDNPELARKYNQTRLTLYNLNRVYGDPIIAASAYDEVQRGGLPTGAPQGGESEVVNQQQNVQRQTQQDSAVEGNAVATGGQQTPSNVQAQTQTQSVPTVNSHADFANIQQGTVVIYNGPNAKYRGKRIMHRVGPDGKLQFRVVE